MVDTCLYSSVLFLSKINIKINRVFKTGSDVTVTVVVTDDVTVTVVYVPYNLCSFCV